MAAALERGSEHPLGEAIVRRAREQGLPLEPVENFESLPGQGVKPFIRGKKFSWATGA